MSNSMHLTHQEWLDVNSSVDSNWNPIPGRPQRVEFNHDGLPSRAVIIYDYVDDDAGAFPGNDPAAK